MTTLSLDDPAAAARPAAASDFDFLHGTWHVRHRKRRERLAGATDWDEFSGEVSCRPILGGLGNTDDNVLHDPAGSYEAITLRLHDPEPGRWSIWWVDARRMTLDPPVQGSFAQGVGTFEGKDTFEGRPIRVRFRWLNITARSARWEQAFSDDDGASWEANSTVAFKRVVPSAADAGEPETLRLASMERLPCAESRLP